MPASTDFSTPRAPWPDWRQHRPRAGRHAQATRSSIVASGRAHDRATVLCCLPFGLLWAPWLGGLGALVVAVSFLVGGLWLSPDLDIHSRPTCRWGPLRGLWWPYRRLLRHRSLLSHSPLLGTAGRLLYLAAALCALCVLAAPLGAPSPLRLLAALQALQERQPGLLLASFAGLEGSAWLHLIQDGDPWPRTPRLLRPLLKRRTTRASGRRRRGRR